MFYRLGHLPQNVSSFIKYKTKTCKLRLYLIDLDSIDLDFKDLNQGYKSFCPYRSVEFYENSNNNITVSTSFVLLIVANCDSQVRLVGYSYVCL